MDDVTPIQLTNLYAQYFVEDFALDVMRHLGGSYPIPADVLSSAVTTAITKEVKQNTLSVSAGNAVGRFLYECAVHALEEDIPAKMERSGWDHVKDLPSQHHPEIRSMVFQSASQYLRAVERTVIGVIGRDAHLTHLKIKALADQRLRTSDSGGAIHEFSWGILSNGLWLNAALARAYDLASVFRSGDPVVAYWAETCFNFAYRSAIVPEDQAAYETAGLAELHALVAQSDDQETIAALPDSFLTEVGSSVFQPGYLRTTVDVAVRGISDVKELIWATERFSTLATALSVLTITSRLIDNDEIISPLVITALSRTNDAVTLALAGIEALRETKFSESLIMLVEPNGDDPTVSVTINVDTMRAFTQASGNDSDLMHFGLYLDPRKGVRLPAVGWSIGQVLEQRTQVIPNMMAEEADRTERFRNNDAAFIDKVGVTILTEVVQSYLAASKRQILPYLAQQIERFGRDISNSTMANDSFSPEARIGEILVEAIGDPFLKQVYQNFMGYVITNPLYAPALSVMHTAVQDAVQILTLEDPAD